jgi:light-regulated signal transduction histidine kinase (bacteriophytochrome)/CheY-like chemotaxis protein
MAETHVQAQFAADLTNCDREPIHQIGAIQPVGFLVALSPDWRIARVSANAPGHLGRPLEALLGVPLGDVIVMHAIHTIRNRLALLHGPDAVERAFAVQLQDGAARFDLAVHRAGQTILIEAEPSQPSGALNAGAMVRAMLTRMQGQTSLLREAARLVQALTGFDRVMIYRFHPDHSGEVIAERARGGLVPFLGLRYPAEDIPRQARALLLRNPVRLLADVAAEPSPIVSDDGMSGEPLDLSMSVLRAHSEMHVEYLRNMGVAATMTISLLRDGRLWGLISCHHLVPRHVGYEQRTTVELFGQMLSLLIEKQERDELGGYESRTRDIHNRLIATVAETGSVGENIVALAGQLSELVPCDGIGVFAGGNATLNNAAPTPQQFAGLIGFLNRTAAGQVYATDHLSAAYAAAGEFVERAAGILVIPISRTPGDYVVFFRQEVVRAVTWAGQPGKLAVAGPHGERLTPRKSFEAWRETVRGHSTPWTEPQLRAAEALRVTLLEVVLQLAGVTEREAKAAAEKQEFLIAELNHRVRNILGLIRGLVAQSRNSANDVDIFATILGDRVHALARAHDQITAKNWGPGSLAILIATEAGAYLGTGAARVHASGPAVLLHPQAFSAMALVVHELMTNAAKYGALSGQDGHVRIEWELDADGALALDWSEVGGPPVQPPLRQGFGTTIIERSIPHELGGEAEIGYHPAGVRARFKLSPRHVAVDQNVPVAPSAADYPAARLPIRLSGTVLLVEDNVVIALDAEDMLLALGARQVAVAGSVREALRLIEMETPSFACLDINLGAEMSWPIATRLRELGVPHIFATGYGNSEACPVVHRSTPTITKPYTASTLASAAAQASSMKQP